MGGPLAASIAVGVETDIDAAPERTQLLPLRLVQMRAQRANGMIETGLPQGRQIKQSLHHNDAAQSHRLLPAIESAFAAGKKAMTAQTIAQRASVEIARLSQREGDTAEERIASLGIDESCRRQTLASIAEPFQIAAQTRAGCVGDAHVRDRSRIVNPALGQIPARRLAAGQLPSIELIHAFKRRLAHVTGGARDGCAQQMHQARQTAAAAAAVAIEQLFAPVDVKGRAAVAMQRAESGDLVAAAVANRL